jgi:hypothetical protein
MMDHEDDYTNGDSLVTLPPELSLALPTRRNDLEKSAKNNDSPMEQNVLTAFGWKPRKMGRQALQLPRAEYEVVPQLQLLA